MDTTAYIRWILDVANEYPQIEAVYELRAVVSEVATANTALF